MAWPSSLARTKNWGTEVLTDSDLEGQFDLIINYINDMMNATTGHKHDATTSEGPKINTSGLDLGSLDQDVNEAKGANVASAATTTIWVTDGNFIHITGTTTITSFGTAAQAGSERTIVFDDALTLTHNSTSLILPGGANITTAAGDRAIVRAETTANARVIAYTKASGFPVIAQTGSAVQVVSTTSTTRVTGSTATPFDNSIPQNTEGIEFLTRAITPTATTNKLLIVINISLCEDADTSDNCTIALHQDTTANALAAWHTQLAETNPVTPEQKTCVHIMDAGTTSATTFKVRAGLNTANTLIMNGNNGGALYGGVLSSSITIMEIKV